MAVAAAATVLMSEHALTKSRTTHPKQNQVLVWGETRVQKLEWYLNCDCMFTVTEGHCMVISSQWMMHSLSTKSHAAVVPAEESVC